MSGKIIDSTFGPLGVHVVPDGTEGRSWRATLAEHHPRLTAVSGALGESEDQAVQNLAAAVQRFGSPWPEPPRLGVLTQGQDEPPPYVRAETVERVLVDAGDAERAGWAVGWRGDQVWVCWHEGGLDGTAWVPAASVRRPRAR